MGAESLANAAGGKVNWKVIPVEGKDTAAGTRSQSDECQRKVVA